MSMMAAKVDKQKTALYERDEVIKPVPFE